MDRIESDEFWDLYWEVRLQELQNLGKREAILAISQLIRSLSRSLARPLRLLELGCGEGQIIGALVDGHAPVCDAAGCIGVDYLPASLRVARRAFPSMTFLEGDFTDPVLIHKLGQFEVVILVNALHEVFSAAYSENLGEVDVPLAKQRVEAAFLGAARCLAPNGYLALFDGLEPPGDPRQVVRLRFLHPQARQRFEQYAREYHPFRVNYQPAGDAYTVDLPRRDFTRYMTKSIFLGKELWRTERFESYQYFTEAEFRAAFDLAGLKIEALRTLTVDEDKWRQNVEILTPGVDFPDEHILIIATKSSGS